MTVDEALQLPIGVRRAGDRLALDVELGLGKFLQPVAGVRVTVRVTVFPAEVSWYRPPAFRTDRMPAGVGVLRRTAWPPWAVRSFPRVS